MTEQNPIRLYGEYCSPYTRKMLCVLRYRGIPYRFWQGGPGGAPDELPKPKVGLLPTFYLNNEAGELEAVVDSTPLIRRFENEYRGRSILPSDSGLAFLDYLLEDYGDEWMTKAMFHYRWAYEDDIQKAGRLLPLQHSLGMPIEEQQAAQEKFQERQITRLYVVGSNEVTAEIIEDSYRDMLVLLNDILNTRRFIFGDRPAASDFAIYGQLTQLAAFDPTPMKVALEVAPRVCAWINTMEDMSGYEVDESCWYDRDQLAISLGALFEEIGQTYVPVMLANAKAVMAGEKEFETTVRGRLWKQPTFLYQARCVQWVREQYFALENGDREWVDQILNGTGCDDLLKS